MYTIWMAGMAATSPGDNVSRFPTSDSAASEPQTDPATDDSRRLSATPGFSVRRIAPDSRLLQVRRLVVVAVLAAVVVT